jgi:serine/threonine protein phosphatase PrpC
VRNNEALRLSFDHKASNEQEADRVRKIGGIIAKNRVSGSLAVTRTLGDLELKSAVNLNNKKYNFLKGKLFLAYTF